MAGDDAKGSVTPSRRFLDRFRVPYAPAAYGAKAVIRETMRRSFLWKPWKDESGGYVTDE